MSALYEQLRAAGSDRERRGITGEVIDEMRLNPHDNVANEAYFSLCDRVINNLGHTAVGRPIDYNGQFPPMVSAFLVMTAPRVSGFLGAIHTLPKVRTAIEAGPGASAIFSVAAAQRGAHVVGMEINEQAAECATEVVRLTGFADQVEIKAGDALAGGLPGYADLAIAELLGPGLRQENGPAVIAALKHHATHVIPDAAVLHATDQGPRDDWNEGPWTKVAHVNLTQPITRVSGAFESVDSGERIVCVRADILAQGREIVAGIGTDDLTASITIGSRITVPNPGTRIEFAYDIGPQPYATPDYVQVFG